MTLSALFYFFEFDLEGNRNHTDAFKGHVLTDLLALNDSERVFGRPRLSKPGVTAAVVHTGRRKMEPLADMCGNEALHVSFIRLPIALT